MGCLGLDHINIVCKESEFAELCDFYECVLGLEVGPRPTMNHQGAWLYGAGRALIHVSIRPEDRAGKGMIDHVAFNFKGLKRQCQHLDEQGVEYSYKAFAGGVVQLFLFDPIGTRIELNFSEG